MLKYVIAMKLSHVLSSISERRCVIHYKAITPVVCKQLGKTVSMLSLMMSIFLA